MKIANMETWVKDNHVHLQLSKKQFEDSDGVVKLSAANLRQLIRMVVDKKAVSPKEMLEAVMRLTTKRLALVSVLAEKLGHTDGDLLAMLDTIATGSSVPERTIVELFLETDALTD